MPSFLTDIWNQITALFTSIGSLPSTTQGIVAFGFMFVGALFCFFGYHFFKYLLGLAGFLTAGVLGLAAAYYYAPQWPEIAHYSIAAVTGAIGALIFYSIFFVFGFLLFGAVATMWLFLLILPRNWGVYRMLITLGAGFTGGLAALILRRQLLILATAAIGALAIVAGVGHFQGWPLSPTGLMQPHSLDGALLESMGWLDTTQQIIIYGVMGLFFVAGLVVQSLLPEKKDNDRNN